MWMNCCVVCGRISNHGLKQTVRGARRLSHFRVVEHENRAQHTRHWPRGTEVGFENALKLAVKQYVPLDEKGSAPGDITFIAGHANGFPKVLSASKSA
jgi:hypothetical protein